MIFSENRLPPSDQVQGQAFPDHALKRAARRQGARSHRAPVSAKSRIQKHPPTSTRRPVLRPQFAIGGPHEAPGIYQRASRFIGALLDAKSALLT